MFTVKLFVPRTAVIIVPEVTPAPLIALPTTKTAAPEVVVSVVPAAPAPLSILAVMAVVVGVPTTP